MCRLTGGRESIGVIVPMTNGEKEGAGIQFKKMPILSTAPVNWNNNDLPGFRPVIPFPDLLDEMRDAGFAVTEYDDSFGTDVDHVRNALDARNMTLSGAYQWVDFLDDDAFVGSLPALDRKLAFMDQVECRHLIVADTLRTHRVKIAGRVPADRSSGLADAAFDTITANLGRLAARCQRLDIRLHYHNHVGTYVETVDEVESLIRRLPGTGVDLCFDSGHLAYAGGDPVAFVADHAGVIGYVHIKDVDGDIVRKARLSSWSFPDALRHYVFCPLGTGDLDFPAIIPVLAPFAMQVIVLEQDTCARDRTETARSNLQYLQSLIEERVDRRDRDNAFSDRSSARFVEGG